MKDKKLKASTFNYVDITTKGCEGWLNLFFGEHVLTMVSDVTLANAIRKALPVDGESLGK